MSMDAEMDHGELHFDFLKTEADLCETSLQPSHSEHALKHPT